VRLSKRLLIVVVPLVAALGYWYWSQRPVFADLHGPAAATVLPTPADFKLDMSAFPRNDVSSLAVLVNDPQSEWYGIASGLSSIGIPFTLVTDPAEALKHKVVMVYPSLTGGNTAPEVLQALAAHVHGGGTLIAFAVVGGGLQEVFGFENSTEDRLHHQLDFADTDFTHAFAASPVESRLYLGAIEESKSGLPGVSYHNPKRQALAVFEDGSAAITHNQFESATGTGHAYALGFDWGHFILQAHGGRAPNAADTYVNHYQPKLDTLLRFLAAVYQQGESNAVLLSPTPHGKDLTVLMSHDIDYTRSIVNAPMYGQVEHDAGVRATYFIQTKYVKDYSDDTFYQPDTIDYLRQLMGMGMEVASHTVAHSRIFNELETGSGTEQYPAYRPFVKEQRKVEGATIAGELRVSKFLLESQTSEHVISFRPGHLSYPRSLPQMLTATGYRYSSSMTANEALTHLPFRDMVDRAYEAPSPVYEFPVTIEDEEGRLGDRVDAAIDVSRHIAAYHGLVTLLVHTDSVDHKLDFVRKYIAALKNEAWFSTVRDYGQWWATREAVSISIEAGSANARRITLTSKDAIDGLTLLLPAGWQYQGGVAQSQQQGNSLSLGSFSGTATLDIAVSAAH